MKSKPYRKGIILAGGKGTRLHPLTLEIPKPLITVHKKPLLNYGIELFFKHGIDNLKIIIREEGREAYANWQNSYKDLLSQGQVEFLEESKPMGTLGYIAHRLKEWVGREHFFVTNGDDLKDVNLSDMHAFHEKGGAHATLGMVKVQNPEEGGSLLLDGHLIRGFFEKQENPPSNLVSAGIYELSPEIFSFLEDSIREGKEFLMFEKDLFPKMAEEGKLQGFLFNGKFFDCGTFERWEKAIREWNK